MNKLFKIAVLFFVVTVSAQSKQRYQDSIQVLISQISSDSLRAAEYYKAGIYAFQPLNDLDLSRNYVDSAMYYSRISKVKDFEAKCNFLYGVINRYEGNYDNALEYLNRNIEYFKKKSIDKPYALFQIAAIHGERGDFESSLKIYYEILRIFEREKDSFAIASTYNNIAADYYEMKKFDKALVNLENALGLFEKLNEKKDIANTIRNIGELHLVKKDTLKGVEYIEKSLAIAKDINEEYEIGYSLYALGNTYVGNHPQIGLQYLLEAKSIIQKGNYKSLLIDINIALGQYYMGIENSKAILYFEAALKLAEELEELSPKKKIYESLSSIHKLNGNFELALVYQAKYIVVNDSILNKENIKTINLLEKQFETEKKEKEIATLSEQKLKNETLIKEQRQQVKWLGATAMGVVAMSVLVFLLFKQRTKNKRQNELIDAISETQNMERKRIAQDLHDSIGGSLALIKNKLEVASDKENITKQDLLGTIETVSKTSDKVRRISHNLMPSELIKFGLVSGIQSILDQIDKDHINAQLYAHNMEQRIDPTKEIQLYRITQEVIQNVLKHAQAKNLTIYLNKYAKHVSLMLEDDGKGYDHASNGGMGISNIKNRIEQLKGTLDIDSSQGRGTTFNIQIPV
ncbi:tetratricopeptide repeat-containing sensor histidine kinase [Maribacter polysiphoniae]|uniref:tetratricopeptide repeat-containing sensor histidine kinase n=1 Tax=Maribacter polysiphoniae TaxID=429344 RepID=UPI00235673A5|nr:sensor histidine kinase [Maribacter polysiphoniae]